MVWRSDQNPYGKPFLSNHLLSFSLIGEGGISRTSEIIGIYEIIIFIRISLKFMEKLLISLEFQRNSLENHGIHQNFIEIITIYKKINL